MSGRPENPWQGFGYAPSRTMCRLRCPACGAYGPCRIVAGTLHDVRCGSCGARFDRRETDSKPV